MRSGELDRIAEEEAAAIAALIWWNGLGSSGVWTFDEHGID
jgi:hypothetical protein